MCPQEMKKQMTSTSLNPIKHGSLMIHLRIKTYKSKEIEGKRERFGGTLKLCKKYVEKQMVPRGFRIEKLVF